MQPIDKETGLPRGYFILKRKEPSNSSILTSKLGITDSKASSLFCSDIPYLLSIHKPETISDAFRVIIDACEYCSVIQTFQIREASKDLAAPVEIQLSNLIQHDLQVKELFKEIQKHPLNQHVKSAIEHSSKMKNILISPQTIDLTTIFFLASPIQMYKTVSPDLFQQLKLIKNLDTMPILLKGEVERISNQLSTLMKI